MKAEKLIASVAAVLFTTATLGALNYHATSLQTASTEINGIKVINLAPVNVRPSAEDQRAAALLADIGAAGLVILPSLGRLSGTGETEQFSLVGSQLAMPYYSFGSKFGRITKE